MGYNHVPKDVSERDSALSWFESLILAHVNAKLFQIRVLKRVLKREKKGVLDRDPPRMPEADSKTCERKGLSERDSCVCILKMRAEAIHKCMGQSARADCAGVKYYLAVRRSPDRDWEGAYNACECTWFKSRSQSRFGSWSKTSFGTWF